MSNCVLTINLSVMTEICFNFFSICFKVHSYGVGDISVGWEWFCVSSYIQVHFPCLIGKEFVLRQRCLDLLVLLDLPSRFCN